MALAPLFPLLLVLSAATFAFPAAATPPLLSTDVPCAYTDVVCRICEELFGGHEPSCDLPRPPGL